MPRTCATCKWMQEPGPLATCHAPRNQRVPRVELMTGFYDVSAPSWRERRCTIQRGPKLPFEKLCGYLGRWWEPME